MFPSVPPASERMASTNLSAFVLGGEVWEQENSVDRPGVNPSLVGGWTNPAEKYDRQNGFVFPK